jgi:hypothetical protein
MTAIVFLPSFPRADIMSEFKRILEIYPYVRDKTVTKDGVYIFLENENELFERVQIEESAKLSAKDDINNPSRRKRY